MKRLHWYLLGVFTVFTLSLFAAKNSDTIMRWGDGTANFVEIFDIGDGASNPQVSASSGKLVIGNVPLTESSITASDIDLGTASDTSRITLGSGTDAALSALTRKAGTLHYSTDQSNVVFDDGSDLRPVGTGSGGGSGINLLDNPDAEVNLNNWTASGGTFTRTIVAGEIGFGDASFKWDSNATAQTLQPDNVVVINGLEGHSCLLSAQYNAPGITVGDYVVRVELASGTALTTDVSLSPTTLWTPIQIAFVCPTNDSIRFIVESKVADALPIFLDQAHLGSSTNEVLVGDQTEIMFDGGYPFQTNCAWDTQASSLSSFNADTDCVSITTHKISATAAIDSSDNDLPDVVFTSLPAGTYRLDVSFTGYSDTANKFGDYAINETNNGIIIAASRFTDNLSGNRAIINLSGTFEHSGGATTLSLFGARNTAGSVLAEVNNRSEELRFILTRYPSDPIPKVTLETQGWFVAAKITGASPSIGTVIDGTYNNVENASLALSLEPKSAAAQIPCSGTNPSTGLTCAAGLEQIGISVEIPYAGEFMYCFSFDHTLDLGTANDDYRQYFKTAITANANEAAVTDGSRVAMTKKQQVSGGSRWRESNSIDICNVFSFSSAGQKTVRLFEQTLGATGSAYNAVEMNPEANGTMGITIYPLTQQFPQAVALTEGSASKAGGQFKMIPSAWEGSLALGASTAQSSLSSITNTHLESSYITSAIWTGGGVGSTTGTLTITIARDGIYRVSAKNGMNAISGGIRSPQLTNRWGGSATRLTGAGTDAEAISAQDIDSDRFYLETSELYNATAGQTIILQPLGAQVSGGGATMRLGIAIYPYY